MPDYPRGSGVPHRGPTRASDELWADTIVVPCTYCRAPIGEKCVHPGLEKRVKRVPCESRIRAAERQAS